MTERSATELLTNVLYGVSVVLVALSFPIQVTLQHPAAALVPYPFAIAGLAVSLFGSPLRLPRRLLPLDNFILVYAFIVCFHLALNSILGNVGLYDILSTVANFLLPLTFYVAFRATFSISGVKAVATGVLASAVFVTSFSVADTFFRQVNVEDGIVSNITGWPAQCGDRIVDLARTNIISESIENYQWRAAEYSRVRSAQNPDSVCHSMRIGGPRSPGLLENSAVSAIWTSFGVVALLTVFSSIPHLARAVAAGVLMACQIYFQYYTGAFATAVSVVFVFLTGVFGADLRRTGFALILSTVGLVAIIVAVVGQAPGMIGGMIAEKLNLFAGGMRPLYLDMTLEKLMDYVESIKSFPPILVVGDGFGVAYPHVFAKGGDIGWVETLAKLGVPLFLTVCAWIMCSVLGMIWSGNRETVLELRRVGVLALSVVLLVAIDELHYSVWQSKSVFPLVLIALAVLAQSEKGNPSNNA